jgi:hypothetical protein
VQVLVLAVAGEGQPRATLPPPQVLLVCVKDREEETNV